MSKQNLFSEFNIDIGIQTGKDVLQTNAYLNDLNKVIKTLTEEGRAFASELRTTKTKLSKSVYIPKEQTKNAERAFNEIKKKYTSTETDESSMYDKAFVPAFSVQKKKDPVEKAKFTRLIKDKFDRAAVDSYVARHGGTMSKSESRKDYYDIEMPRAVVGETASGRKKFSDTETKNLIRRRNKAHDQRVEDARPPLEYDPVKHFESKGDYANAGLAKQGEEAYKKRKKEEDKEAEGKDNDKSSTKDGLSKLKPLLIAGLIYKSVKKLIREVQKIVAAVGHFADKSAKQTLGAQKLGITPAQYVQAQRFSTSIGLEEDTVVSAMQGFQDSFGSKLHIDVKKLTGLAPLIGNAVETLIAVSGADNVTSKDALGVVLDTAFKNVIAGVTPTGEQHGETKALAETMTVLEKAGLKDAAEILNKMVTMYHSSAVSPETKNTMLKDGFIAWMEKRDAITGARSDYAIQVAQDYALLQSELKAFWATVKDSLFDKLIDFLRPFMTAFEKLMIRLLPTAAAKALAIDEIHEKNAGRRESILDQLNYDKFALKEEEEKIKQKDKLFSLGGEKPKFSYGEAVKFAELGALPLGVDFSSDSKELEELMSFAYAYKKVFYGESAVKALDDQLTRRNPEQLTDTQGSVNSKAFDDLDKSVKRISALGVRAFAFNYDPDGNQAILSELDTKDAEIIGKRDAVNSGEGGKFPNAERFNKGLEDLSLGVSVKSLVAYKLSKLALSDKERRDSKSYNYKIENGELTITLLDKDGKEVGEHTVDITLVGGSANQIIDGNSTIGANSLGVNDP